MKEEKIGEEEEIRDGKRVGGRDGEGRGQEEGEKWTRAREILGFWWLGFG